MTAWPADQLAVIATADELLIAPQRTDATAMHDYGNHGAITILRPNAGR